MVLKINSRKQITLPTSVLDALGVDPGDQIEIIEGPDGFKLRPREIDYSSLGTLKEKIRRGHDTFDIQVFREQPYDPSLKD